MTAVEAPPTDAILSAERVSKIFGGLIAVNDVSFFIPRRSIVSIIGPNGAGKTTFFNMLTGFYRPTIGRIRFGERNITGARPDIVMKAGLFGSIFRPPWVMNEEKTVRVKAREMLEYVGLREAVFDELAINLAYGDQRRVEIARALATEPKLLLLDEPTAGMNPRESHTLTDLIGLLRRELSLSILLIEHDMQVVMRISDRITVLDYGTRIAEGTPTEIQRHPRVIEAYLGTGAPQEPVVPGV